MFFLFFFFWVMLNGRLTAEIAVFGIVIAAAMYWFICRYMGYSVKKDLKIARRVPYLIVYFCVLVLEIILATNTMLRYLLLPEKKPEPAIVHFQSNLKHPETRMLLANSITLTPGTLTVDLVDDDFYVHCYDKSLGEGIENSVFVRMLKRMEGSRG